MGKALQGAAMLAGAVGMGVAAFFDPALIASPLFDKIWEGLIIGGISMEAGALADMLFRQGTNTTIRQSAAYRQTVRGEQRIGGVEIYQSTTGSHHDQYNRVIVLAGHEVDSIVNLYLDGRQVYWQGSGPGYSVRNGVGFGGIADGSDHIGPGGQKYNFGGTGHSGLYCEARFGDQLPGDVMGSLTANDPNWAADGLGNSPYVGGCTYVYLKLEYNTDVFPQGPGAVEIRFTVRGKNDIYDPRTGTEGYTSNWALHVADVIESPAELGDVGRVNTAQLIAAANVCDESVALANGNTEARYALHWNYNTAVSPGDVLATMMPAAQGRLSYIGGEWYIWPAYWQGPSFDFDESMLSGDLSWEPYRSMRDLVNRVNGTYIAPNYPFNDAGNLYDSNGWYNGMLPNTFPFAFQPTNYPQYAQDVLHGYGNDIFLEEDSGVLGPWDSATTYDLGDVVTDTGVIYKSLVANNLANTPASAPAAYDSTVTYSIGNQVTESGVIYQSLINSNLNNDPAASPTDWAVSTTAWTPYNNQLPLELTQSCVLSVAQAQRCAKIALLRNRQQGSGTFPLHLACWRMQPLDVFTFSFDAVGWADKQLEVVSTALKLEEQDGVQTVRFEIKAQETNQNVYEWSASEELTVYDVPANPTAGFPYSVDPPTSLTATSSSTTALIGTDGVVTPRILASWVAPTDVRVTQIQVQYQKVGDTTWQDAGSVDVGTTSVYISNVISGQTYNVQIRSLTNMGGTSVWVVATGISVTAPNSLQSTYTNNPQFSLTQPTSTTIAVASVAVTFGSATVTYAARTLTISAPSVPTWYYVSIADPTQVGESGSPTLTATPSTTTSLVGVSGHTYLGAILALPAGSATSILAGGWPAPQSFQVVA